MLVTRAARLRPVAPARSRVVRPAHGPAAWVTALQDVAGLLVLETAGWVALALLARQRLAGRLRVW